MIFIFKTKKPAGINPEASKFQKKEVTSYAKKHAKVIFFLKS